MYNQTEKYKLPISRICQAAIREEISRMEKTLTWREFVDLVNEQNAKHPEWRDSKVYTEGCDCDGPAMGFKEKSWIGEPMVVITRGD